MPHSYSLDEPARQKAYRRLYMRIKLQLDRHDDMLNYLLIRIERLEQKLGKQTPDEALERAIASFKRDMS